MAVEIEMGELFKENGKAKVKKDVLKVNGKAKVIKDFENLKKGTVTVVKITGDTITVRDAKGEHNVARSNLKPLDAVLKKDAVVTVIKITEDAITVQDANDEEHNVAKSNLKPLGDHVWTTKKMVPSN